ncbi:MAG: QueT transporter family protein [Lachnospiraceae bacterium]|nr:QueT transporter family protein [Lachnospiraceae bacterium]
MFQTRSIAIGGLVAAVYVVVTLVFAAFGLSSNIIQIRLSEALCIMPCFCPAAVPGLFVGCLISNLIAGAGIFDIIFGSLATLIGAIGTYLLRKNRWLALVPPVVANVLVIPAVLVYGYGIHMSYLLAALYIFIGEFISCYVFGEILYSVLKRNSSIFNF